MLVIISHEERANQTQSETPPRVKPTGWLQSQKQKRTSFGEDIRKLEPSSIACERVKSYSHGRKQFGSSSKSLT